jgi:CTP:molybdopterin cytidylyltransferase MocA
VSAAGLLLAAGAGRRFGQPKALVTFRGQTLVERGIRMLQDGGCEPVLVVLGAAAAEVRPLTSGATVVVSTEWELGLGASLQAGLRALEQSDAGACVIALVDQPLVQAAAVRRLLCSGAADAAVATYGGQVRNPVLLTRSIWAEVAVLADGDVGARAWLRMHTDRVTRVPCDDVGSPDDVDTPADLATLLRAAAEPPAGR